MIRYWRLNDEYYRLMNTNKQYKVGQEFKELERNENHSAGTLIRLTSIGWINLSWLLPASTLVDEQVTISKDIAAKIYELACSDWKSKIVKYLTSSNQLFNSNYKVSLFLLLEGYESCDSSKAKKLIKLVPSLMKLIQVKDVK